MRANSELDQLLQDLFDITTTDFVAALKTLPALRPWAAALTEDEARLLDDADFTEDRDAFLTAGTEIAGHVAHLAVTALTADVVAAGLGVSPSRVRQKRLARELWAIPDGQTWRFPVLQFETDVNGGPTRQIRGLDRVFKALPADLHPVAVAGFLRTPQLDLFHDRPMTPVEWLRAGGDVALAVAAAASADWYTA
ncbi:MULTISPECIES: hypothetical protein [unclassified Mycolicibacterium]|uniref:hypothetical protein n=1 Tax=unclassified Mycolicibacterium TaxID=2636767 RepID=UPI0012DEA7AD|nr:MULTISPECIES: hypothetical protein [unclassified Mycolicibacterium]MUL82182.1 hypothetical protein [Mycolicibacterium sp. CBMA 329]MUL87948.1 hypothetical protein [Mycolicibacterium sp. CBMA 331]MUM02279.1 hypothetical protein [Mycolicibacterium sp. CBMA 334]MUM26437.1 hypothetical protein [Mycolicibacterium sp. CBMA 295]MUM38245.1 hypothetical protein [Mycolicibacterium sp. CBMA 247]